MTEQGLKQALPSKFVLAVIVGGVIGLGILRGPGEIAEVIPDPLFYLALWLFGGLFVLLSTAVCAELVGMTPRSGGTYSLIRRAFGREPDSERPYRAWGHPYSTIVCLIGWTLITVFQAFAERETAIYAVAMIAVSWPVYWYLVRK